MAKVVSTYNKARMKKTYLSLWRTWAMTWGCSFDIVAIACAKVGNSKISNRSICHHMYIISSGFFFLCVFFLYPLCLSTPTAPKHCFLINRLFLLHFTPKNIFNLMKHSQWDDYHHTWATKRVNNTRGYVSNESQIHFPNSM